MCLHVHAILSEYQSGYAIYMYEKYKAYMYYLIYWIPEYPAILT